MNGSDVNCTDSLPDEALTGSPAPDLLPAIDFHTHTFPDAIAGPTLEKMSRAGGLLYHTAGTEAALAASMRQAGVVCSVVLPVVTNPAKAAHINDYSAANDRGGIVHFGGVHPDTPDAEKEIRRIARLGLRGVKLHPVYQRVDFDDPRYLRILYAAAENGLTVVTHAGWDVGFPGVGHATADKIESALRQVGNVRLVLAHMGAWRQWEQAEKLAAFKNVYIDTAFSLGEMTVRPDCTKPEEFRRLAAPDDFVRIIRAFGAGRVLFGTDSPWCSQASERAKIEALPLLVEEKRMILYENAKKLLNTETGGSPQWNTVIRS